MAQRIEEDAWRFADIVDWRRVEKLSKELVIYGTAFYQNVLKKLQEAGLDISNPLQLLVAFERLGADAIERLFNIGEPSETKPRGFLPRIPTSTYERFLKAEQKVLAAALKDIVIEKRQYLVSQNRKKKVLIASTDIHVYAYDLLCASFGELGFEVLKLGTSVDPETLVENIKESRADFVAITTWNGMALSYGREIMKGLKKEELKTPAVIFMGGRLLEDIDGVLGKNVEADLNKIGVRTPKTIADLIRECTGIA